MINIGTGVADIINNPDAHGIGASIKDTKTKTKVETGEKNVKIIKQTNKNNKQVNLIDNLGKAIEETLKDSTKKTTDIIKKKSEQITSNINTATADGLAKEIFGIKKDTFVGNLVDDMMGKTIDKMIEEQIDKGKLSLQTSKLGTTYATAYAYYKKLYDGSIIMTELRNKTEKNIAKTINQRINDKVASWQKGLPNWQKKLLANSKLMSSLTAAVNVETKKYIEAIFSDKTIKGINDAVIGNLKKIKNTINETIQVNFKDQIAYVKKLRTAIQEKIVFYQKLKKEYEQKIQKTLDEFKKQLTNVISKFTEKLVSTLTSAIKINVGSIKF